MGSTFYLPLYYLLTKRALVRKKSHDITIIYCEYHHNVLRVLPGTTIISNILGYHHNILRYEKMSKLEKNYQI